MPQSDVEDMAHTLTQKWLRQNVSAYVNADRVYVDVDATLTRYPTLRVKTDTYTYDDGRTQLLLCLHNVIPITFRGAAYNIPVAIWISRDYPSQPPLAYVVPTSDMLVKAGKFIDLSGRCDLEYSQLWRRKSEGCSITSLVEAMQAQFSLEPPVYAKPKEATRPTPTPASPSGSYAARPPPPLPSNAPSPQAYNNTPMPSGRPVLPPKPGQLAERPDSVSPVPASTPLRPVPSFTQAEPTHIPSGSTQTVYVPQSPTQSQYRSPHEHRPSVSGPPPPPPPWTGGPSPPHRQPVHSPSVQWSPQRPGPPLPSLLDDDSVGEAPTPVDRTHAPPRPPNPELLRLHNQVHERMRSETASLAQAFALDAERLRTQQSDLLLGEPAIRDEMARLEAVRDVCRNVGNRMRSTVEQAERNMAEIRRKGDPEVDELVCSTTIVYNQLINLVAEDNAIEDTIYHLHRALNSGRVDLERFLRTTRILAEEQFMKRALIEKIQANLPIASSWA